jgi:hypothetical protein
MARDNEYPLKSSSEERLLTALHRTFLILFRKTEDQLMLPKEILDLSFNRASALKDFWNIFIVVGIGVVTIMVSAKPFTGSPYIKIILTLTFLTFAVSNLLALHQTNRQRNELLNMLPMGEFTDLVKTMRPETAWVLALFHGSIDVLVCLAIWIVPWQGAAT